MRRLFPFIGASLALALLVSLAFAPAADARAPRFVEGLDQTARVIYDQDGTPHIYAASDSDAYYMLGYVHAQDRYFQMDTLRRQFSGTLAEVLGPAAVPSDVQLRTLGLRRAAAVSYEAYPAITRAWLQAYADGVHAARAQLPLPAEYQALELTTSPPWTPVDSIAIVKGLAFGLSFDLNDIDLTVLLETYAAAGAVGGFDGAALATEDLARSAPFDDRVSIPEFAGALFAGIEGESPSKSLGFLPSASMEEVAGLARQLKESYAGIPMLERTFEGQRGDIGSNFWVISGDHTDSGYPILANDPHLGLDTPSTFYQAHLIAFAPPGQRILNVSGVTFPGAPAVVQGCNKVICWGSTTNPLDVTDVYLEQLVIDPDLGIPVATIYQGNPEPLTIIPESYFVNVVGDGVADNLVDSGLPAEQSVTLVVPRRNNGPIVAIDLEGANPTALSVQYSGWGATFEAEAFRRWARAGSLDDYVEALQYFDVGSQNWVVADRFGNIAYYTSAEMPLRDDLQNLNAPDGGIPPFFIRDGTGALRHEWIQDPDPGPNQALPYEVLPFAEMPQIVNPASGYIANANNDPVGTTLDNNPLNQLRLAPEGGLYYLNAGYTSLRQGRIDRALKDLLAAGPVSVAQMQELQSNNQLLDAELVSGYLVDAFLNANDADAPDILSALGEDPGIAEAVTRIAFWDFSSPTGIPQGFDPGDDPAALAPPGVAEVEASIAATIWSAFRGQLVRWVVDYTLDDIGLGDELPGSREAYRAVENLLENFDTNGGVGVSGVDFFDTGIEDFTAEQNRDLKLLLALGDALDLLASDEFADAFGGSTDQNDYRWGLLHRIVFDHPLGVPFTLPNDLILPNVTPELAGFARSGGYEAVDASSHSARADGVNEFMFGAGPARRFVGVLDPAGIEGYQSIPGGASAELGSPFYASMLLDWLTNNYHPLILSTSEVQASRSSQRVFQPAP
ncbi:MAG: penicillin acylase family protein [Acidobacteriota bacterium]